MKQTILFLIIIILLSLLYPYLNQNIKEGMMYPPDKSMIKNVSHPSETEILKTLNELFIGTNNHETRLKVYDTNYKSQNVTPNPNHNISQNISTLLNHLKRQDNELIYLTKNPEIVSYVPSNSLNKLLDGSLIKPLHDRLMKIHKFPQQNIMGPEECDTKVLLKQANILTRHGYHDDSDELRKKIVKLDNGIEKCKPVDPEPRISLDEVNARVQLTTMYYINDIIQYHEVAIENVAKSIEKFVKKVNNLS